MSLNVDLPVRSKPTDTADVVFVARDVRDGSVVASGTDTIALPARARPGAATGSSAWRVQFNVPAGSYLMRTVVREPGGLMGSADRRLDVRPLDGPEIAVSDLVLGSALSALPVRPRASAGAGLSGVIEAYARAAVQVEQLAVTIQLRKHGVEGTVSSFPAEVLDAESSDGGFMRRARFQMPLDGIAPGDYIAHAVVRANGEIVAERTRQLEVVEASTAGQTDTTGAVQERVSPADVVGGELGRRYVAELSQRADSAAVREAARHASQGNWEQVELGLRRVTEEAGASVPALRGLALFVREDFAGAAAALAAALEADGRNALTAFFLGWAQEGVGEPRAALSAWRNAAYLDPTLVSAHIALADGYLRLSQPALAVQALRAGLAALPDSTELRDRLARLEKPRDMPSPSHQESAARGGESHGALIPREARSRRARSEQQGATHGGASESERWQVVGVGPHGA
jgi:hypothetical protein